MSKWTLKRALAAALAVIMAVSIPELSNVITLGAETGGTVLETTENDAVSNTESTIIYEEIVDLGTIETSANRVSFFSEASVSLKSGNYAEWIDRIDVPDYAIDFYDALVEGADNDGTADILIDDTYYTEGTEYSKTFNYTDGTSATCNVITVATLTSTANDFNHDQVLAELYAVCNAFDRDHPEVFWLSNATSASYSVSSSGGQYTATYYIILKNHTTGYDRRAAAYQSKEAITEAIQEREDAVSKILGGAQTTDTIELIKYFNEWLTKNNEYCTTQVGGDYPSVTRESLTALKGSTGADGPVCEGYARAFKVLCDEMEIPCVLVNGDATSDGSSGEAHMWNYVQAGGAWYAVDVTWNDPVMTGKNGAVSGYESEDWLLLGSESVVYTNGTEELTFIKSHPVSNTASEKGVAFINGPELSKTKYVYTVPSIQVTVDTTTLTYGYTAGATVTATFTDADPVAAYQWYQKAADADTEVSGATSNVLPTGLDAGTYYCKVTCGTESAVSPDVTVEKAKLTPQIEGNYTKTYDGTTTIDNSQGSLSIGFAEGIVDGVTATADFSFTDANVSWIDDATIGGNVIRAANITLSGEKAANYELTATMVKVKGIGMIDTKAVTEAAITLQNDGKLTYNGKEQTMNVTEVKVDGAVVPSASYEVYDNTQTDAGTYTLSVSCLNGGNYHGTVSAKFSIEYLSFDGEITYNGISAVQEWYTEDVAVAADGYMVSTEPTGTYEESYVVNSEGQNSSTVLYFKNAAGYITEGIAISGINIDKTAPSFDGDNLGIEVAENFWKKLLNTITFDVLFQEYQDVSITAEDSGSGIAGYYYYVDKTGSTTVKTTEELAKVAFTSLAEGSTFALNADGKHVIYAYAVDNAGNESSYICSDGIVIDATAPEITVTAPTVDNGNLKDTSAEISFTSNETGKYNYLLAETGADSATPFNDIEMIAGNNSFTVDGLKPNTAYTVYLVAEDEAGNAAQEIEIRFTTRKTIPIFSVTPAITGTYGQTLGQMTINAPATSENGIAGSWSVSAADAERMPEVGDAAEYALTFTPKNAQSYDTYTVEIVPTVTKKAITVTINDETRTYGTDNPAFAVVVPDGALVKGDTVGDLDITFSTTAAKESDAGTYAITGVSNAANYEVTITEGTLTINKAKAPEIADIKKEYTYTLGSKDVVDINLAEWLPESKGTTTYETVSEGTILSEVGITGDTLSYKVAAGNQNDAASITVTAVSKNYEDITIKVNITLVNKTSVSLAGEVTATGSLTYGDALGKLTLTYNTDAFEDADGNPVTGTIAWDTSDAVLNAGTHKPGWTFTPSDSDQYMSVSGTVTIEVAKVTPVASEVPTASGIVYGKTLADSILSGGKVVYADGSDTEVKGTWAWKDASIAPVVADSNTTQYEIVFTPEDTANYNTVEQTVTVTVEVAKATPVAGEVPAASGIVYGKTLADSILSGGKVVYADGSDAEVKGTWAWKDASITPVVADSSTTQYEIVFTPEDTANYNTITVKVTIVVEQAEIPSNAPKTEMKADAEKVSDIVLPKDWEWKAEDAGQKIVRGEEVKATAVYTAEDAANYKTIEVAVTITLAEPKIVGEDGKEGWDVIQEEIKTSQNTEEIKVDMNGAEKVDRATLETLKEADKTMVLVFKEDDGTEYTWTIDGADVKESEEGEFDEAPSMSVELFNKDAENKPEIPKDLVEEVANDKKDHKFLSLDHEGEFGFKGILTLNVGEENAGKLVTLYYYNQAEEKLEDTVNLKIVADTKGNVSFAFTHASDYVITIEDKPAPIPPAGDGTGGTETPPAGDGTGGTETPPAGDGTGGTETPPAEDGTGGTNTPPAGDGTGGTETPPAGDGTDEPVNPPAGGDEEEKDPSDGETGGTETPPAGDGTEEPKDPSDEGTGGTETPPAGDGTDEPVNPPAGEDTDEPSAPQTGDNLLGNVYYYFALLLMGAIAAYAGVRRKYVK